MVNRVRKSKIWELPKLKFEQHCKKYHSLADILRSFNLHAGAGNYKTLKKRIHEENIDISHIPQGLGSNKNRSTGGSKPTPLEKVAVENSKYPTKSIKAQILKLKLIEYKCAICSLEGVWNNKPLILRLDHINGVSNDHRISNLRFVCPNCDSQLPTFAGRNRKYKNEPQEHEGL